MLSVGMVYFRKCFSLINEVTNPETLMLDNDKKEKRKILRQAANEIVNKDFFVLLSKITGTNLSFHSQLVVFLSFLSLIVWIQKKIFLNFPFDKLKNFL